MPFDERSFDNPFIKSKVKSSSVGVQNLFPENFKSRVEQFLLSNVKVIIERLQDGSVSSKDISVYTGVSGIAWMLIKLQKSEILKDKTTENFYELAYKITKHNDSKRASAITFLCGMPGALIVKAMSSKSLNKQFEPLLKAIIDMGSSVCETNSSTYDEYLYGRAGYLGCLVFMGLSFPEFKDEGLANKVCEAIILSGLTSAKKQRAKQPMLFEWHESEYIGGAHGYAGIFYFLLKHKHCPSVQKVLSNELKDSLYWFLDLQYADSGNYPSSIGSKTDKLVHWCHGAPSAVYTLIAAYQEYGDERFKQAALKCGDCVWRRGFLKKGYGICHGTSGNAYTFLALYRLTRDQEHLHRAICFAQLCLDYNKPHRTPDRPFSLFEGLAGTMCFLMDMLDVENARFPCYEL